MKRIGLLMIALVCAGGSVVGAQTTADGGPDQSKVRMRIGPLWLNPTLALTNLGVDNNVFNQPTGEAQRDFTLTLTPATDVWLRMGRTWLTSNIKEDVVWFQKFSSERSANNSYSLGWTVPLNRLSIATSGAWLSTRERPGYEIDARSQRNEQNYKGSADLRFFAKTSVGVSASVSTVSYDKAAVFLGTNLHDELNRTTTSGAITIKHQLTPLTALSFSGGRSQDRFEFSSLRDSNSTTATVGVIFDPAALLKGGATFGYRDFQPLAAGLPGFRGGTVALDLAYDLLDVTRFAVTATRDVQYSFDVNQPYYLLTGVNASVTQQVYGPLDIGARIGAERLEYQDRAGAAIQVSNRTDYVHSYGGSVGYHISGGVRLAFNVDDQKRTSAVSDRQYDGLRYGTSVTYGF